MRRLCRFAAQTPEAHALRHAETQLKHEESEEDVARAVREWSGRNGGADEPPK